MKPAEVVERARAAIRMNIGYHLGAGGKSPRSGSPAEAVAVARGRLEPRCDCSGLTCWCWGISRQTKDPFHLQRSGGWIFTDSMAADARDPRGIFDLVPEGHARPSDGIVFPSKRPTLRYGHVGIVSQVRNGRPVRVIHCSPRNGPNAIAETDCSVFWEHDARVVRYTGLDRAAADAQVLVISGRMSTFGGPADGPAAGNRRRDWLAEGLALLAPADVQDPRLSKIFLPEQPPGTTGLARRLNPRAFYVACRFDYKKTPKSFLRTADLRVRNPRTGAAVNAVAADWGPSEASGRVADLSPGLADYLGLTTDDECEVIVPMPPRA